MPVFRLRRSFSLCRRFPSFECKRKTFVIISILVWLTLVYTLIQIDSLFYIFFWHFFLSFFSFGMIKVISKISERLNEFGCSLPLSYRSKLKGCGVNKESMGWKEMQSKETHITAQHNDEKVRRAQTYFQSYAYVIVKDNHWPTNNSRQTLLRKNREKEKFMWTVERVNITALWYTCKIGCI